MLLYDSLILSQLIYCNIIWAAAYKSSLTKINSLQKRALKLCLEKSYQYSRTNNFQSQEDERSAVSVFKCTNRLSVQNINLCQTLKFIYQVLNKTAPPCFDQMFTRLSSVHSYQTRSDTINNLFLKQAKTNSRKLLFQLEDWCSGMSFLLLLKR